MTITIFVGDVGEYLADVAKKHDVLATLIDSSNYQNLSPGTYYTNIGNLDTLSNFGQVLQQADTIVYAPSTQWSNECNSVDTMLHWTKKYLSIFCCDPAKIVIGFDVFPSSKAKMLTHADIRRSKECQIWIAGCSISCGIGVDSHERYGELIAAELNQSVSFLTAPGSSIKWASDQILRSDIQAGDTIFWGITGPGRLSYWDESVKDTRCAVLNMFSDHKFLKLLVNEKYLTSEHMIYESLIAIYNVINFCKINNIKLILATLIEGMESYLQNFTNFVPLAGIFGQSADDRFLDLGTDNLHPGPNSHKFYKEKMLKLYYQIEMEHT